MIEIINYDKFKDKVSFRKYSHSVLFNMDRNGFSHIHEEELNQNEKPLEVVHAVIKARKIEDGTIVYRRFIGSDWRLPWVEIFWKSNSNK